MIDGAGEKVPQFIIPLLSIYNKKICTNEQNCIFEHSIKVKAINSLYKYIFLFKNVMFTCGLYYKHIAILNDNSSIVRK